jgi:hypothetical protein
LYQKEGISESGIREREGESERERLSDERERAKDP